MYFNILIEGILDEAVATKIVTAAGYDIGTSYGKKGFGYIKKRVKGFNSAARFIPILTLVDFMDTRISCPPDVISNWVPHRSPNMHFRVVVRELESWLMSDRRGIAKFLRTNIGSIPRDPENIDDPKTALINLARSSRSRKIREAIVPKHNSTSTEGPLYNSELIRYIYDQWSLDDARKNSHSLDRCLASIEQ